MRDRHVAEPPDAERAEAVARAAAERAIERTAGQEFSTFRCGSAVPATLRAAPRSVQDAFREAVRLRLRARLEQAWPDRRFDQAAPDVIVEALPDALDAAIVTATLFVAGRYRKLARGLSQTVLHCRDCRGRPRGCGTCGGSGRVYPECVEDFVRPAIQRAAGGASSAFHGAGREDVDVRMLGRGRPFVVSVEDAQRRAPAFEDVAREVEAASGGRVEVEGLAVVDRDAMRRVTVEHGAKTYRVVIEPAAEDFPPDAADRIRGLSGAALAQRTPSRVDGRRADLVRTRRILGATVEECGPRRIVVVLATDAGTYVKEFVTGDAGRTSPSAAQALGVPCVCAELDVLGVAGGPPVTS